MARVATDIPMSIKSSGRDAGRLRKLTSTEPAGVLTVSGLSFNSNRRCAKQACQIHLAFETIPSMSTHPYAGKPAPKDLLIDVSRLEAAFYGKNPILPTLTSLSASAQAAIAARARTPPLPKPISWPLLRPSANTGTAKELLARCSWAKTLTRFPALRSVSHWRFSPQTG